MRPFCFQQFWIQPYLIWSSGISAILDLVILKEEGGEEGEYAMHSVLDIAAPIWDWMVLAGFAAGLGCILTDTAYPAWLEPELSWVVIKL